VCSQFFLNPDHWQVLQYQLLPRLLESRPSLRIWSAGCHLGKEPYGLAMILDELDPARKHYILATDRDQVLLTRARAGGPFTDRDIEQLSPRQGARYLQVGGPPFFVTDRLMRMVNFRQHDLLADRFESNFDLILYRDVEPFFTPSVGHRLHLKFFEALRPGGVLFIGSTDTIPHWQDIGFHRYNAALYHRP
jgi:chemotaxis protein methyltransferase CheR